MKTMALFHSVSLAVILLGSASLSYGQNGSKNADAVPTRRKLYIRSADKKQIPGEAVRPETAGLFRDGNLTLYLQILKNEDLIGYMLLLGRGGNVEPFWIGGAPEVCGVSNSPGGKWLLIKTGGLTDPGDNLRFYICDLKGPVWKPEAVFVAEQGPLEKVYSSNLAWSPNDRFLAFFSGGISTGGNMNWDIFTKPVLYDTLTKRSHPIPTPSGDSIGWTHRNTLLMSGMHSVKRERTDGRQGTTIREVSAIYEIDPVTFRRAVMSDDATGPIAESPNGRWLAFLGAPRALRTATGASQGGGEGEGQSLKGGLAVTPPEEDLSEKLCLQIQDGKSRTRYNIPSITGFNDLHWAGSSKTLYVLEEHDISAVDVESKKVRPLASLPAIQLRDDRPAEYGDDKIIGVSADNKYLFLVTQYFNGPTLLRAVEFTSGKIVLVSQTQSSADASWSVPMSSATPSIPVLK